MIGIDSITSSTATAFALGGSGVDPRRAVTPALDLPPAHYQAIGAIAARWTWLEHQLGVLIREILRLDKKQGRVLLVGMALKPKCNMLRILAMKRVKDASLRAALMALAKDCKKMLDPRNDHVHGLYGYPAERPELIGVLDMESGEQRYTPDFRAPILPELERIDGELRALQVRAKELTERLKKSGFNAGGS